MLDQKGRELSTLNYDYETDKWHAGILKREYNSMLDEQIGFDQIEKVKKLTEKFIEASNEYSLQETLNQFEKENGIN